MAAQTEGGFSAVARYLTARFGFRTPMDRRQVYEWNRRRTVNRRGQMFPSPAGTGVYRNRRRPVLVFVFAEVEVWYLGQPPGPYGIGWLDVSRSDV